MDINTTATFMLVALSKLIAFHHSSPRFAGPSSQNSSGSWKNPDSGPALDRQMKTRRGAAYRGKALIFLALIATI
jgi:hypothetical protein